jgi:amino acid transporter
MAGASSTCPPCSSRWRAGMLIAGTRESATLNIVLVIIKLVALAVFVTFALPAFDGKPQAVHALWLRLEPCRAAAMTAG